MRAFKTQLRCGAMVVALLAPAGAYAQTAVDADQAQTTAAAQPAADPQPEAGEPDNGTDIIVTATRGETRLQDTPLAVSALSATTLRDRNVATIQDVAAYVPNLSIGNRAGTGSAGGSVSIRGMGVDAQDSSAAVGIYLDEVYFASSRGNILGLLDVERVEVLRGPQGTLFGRNTIAGAIQYVSRAPGRELGGYVSGTYGSFDRTDLSAALNLPVTDRFSIRVSGMYNDRDGYIYDIANDVDRGAEETWAVRMRARWTPADWITIDLKGEHLEQESNGRPVLIASVNPLAQFVGLAVLFGETTPLTNAYISPNRRSFAGYNGRDGFESSYSTLQSNIQIDLSETVRLKSITSYSWYRTELYQDFDMTPLSILSVATPYNDFDVFTQELQLAGRALGGRLEWTVGGYYFDSQQLTNQLVSIGFGPPLDQGRPSYNIVAKALYAQGTFHFSDQFSAVAGLRYSHEKNTTFLIGVTQPSSITFEDLSPTFGLNFEPNEETLIYARVARGFRAGGFAPSPLLPNNGLAFDPETAWTYEFGVRLELLDRRLRINPTIFQTDWNAIQFNRLVPTPQAPVATTDNVGDARIRGLELEVQFQATPNFLLTGSMSLLDSKYTRVDGLTYSTFPMGFPGPSVELPNVTLDTELMRAPGLKFSLGARYTVPLPRDSNLLFSLDYAWVDEQYSSVTIADRVLMPSYGLLNGRIQYTLPGGRASIAAFATNLTNEYYLVGGTDFARGATGGVEEHDPGRPREFGVELRFSF
ncbi:MAG TPA: TonB-dependent receptor [Allosphingosinicella sp.]|nr:TonB-dependent receptor [Allosphingosinicella sp.]